MPIACKGSNNSPVCSVCSNPRHSGLRVGNVSWYNIKVGVRVGLLSRPLLERAMRFDVCMSNNTPGYLKYQVVSLQTAHSWADAGVLLGDACIGSGVAFEAIKLLG